MSNGKIKTIFIGTSDFGIPALRALAQDRDLTIEFVVTQPDKPSGRRQKMASPPVRCEGEKLGLKIFQPVKINELAQTIKNVVPDVIVVAAYGQIIPADILSIPVYGCLNIHASLLPKCRGAACIAGAILENSAETGLTIMKMDENLDTGPILAQKSLPIRPGDTAGSLFIKLSSLGGELIIPVLKDYLAGRLKPRPQSVQNASYYKTLKRSDGRIDWQKPAADVERFIRAMSPWPGAFSDLDLNCQIKIIEADHEPRSINKHEPGMLFTDNHELLVQCGRDALIVKKLQLSGKNIIGAAEFLRGHKKHLDKILK